jgi:prepilin-type N-terminal cleavage/methylation domain-containing protein
MIQKKSHHSKASAFTLIEMMVSVSLFLIVMVISLGAVLAIVDGNKKAQAINSVSNNLSSAIESMVRDIKTGYAYSCPVGGTPLTVPLTGVTFDTGAGTCIPGIDNITSEIAFISTISGDKRSVKYEFIPGDDDRGKIVKTFCSAAKISCSNPGDYTAIDITSPDIDIENMEFRIRRPDSAASTPAPEERGQPSVFMLLKGTAYVNKTKASDFSMQTFVSQRVLNI